METTIAILLLLGWVWMMTSPNKTQKRESRYYDV